MTHTIQGALGSENLQPATSTTGIYGNFDLEPLTLNPLVHRKKLHEGTHNLPVMINIRGIFTTKVHVGA